MEWNEVRLDDLAKDVAYGYTASATDNRIGPHFLRITDIQGGTVNWAEVPYCEIEKNLIPKYSLADGDIVIARTGNSTGENYLYRGKEAAVFASYLIRFRIDHEKADPAYVWYNLRSSQWKEFVSGAKTGSAQAGANAKVLGSYKLPLPPLLVRRTLQKYKYPPDQAADAVELVLKQAEALSSNWSRS